jgi:uncharacterized protein (TIGR02001 family)
MRYQNLLNAFFPRSTALLYLLLVAPSSADWHGELSFLSNYVYRGYSKSQDHPVVQGNLDYQDDSGWFGGLGLSQVNFDKMSDHANVEIKPYLGWTLPFSAGWKTELSVSGYIYDGKIIAQDADYVEFGVALHYQDWLSGKISVAPNAYQHHAVVPSMQFPDILRALCWMQTIRSMDCGRSALVVAARIQNPAH